MSSPEEILVARLAAITAVTNIVSTRIYSEKQPQKTAGDSIVYRRIATRRVNSAGGATKTAEARLQLRLMCGTYDTAKTLAAAVRGDPENGNGATGLSGWSDNSGQVWHLLNEQDDPGPIKPAQDEFEDWGIRMDFGVWYSD